MRRSVPNNVMVRASPADSKNENRQARAEERVSFPLWERPKTAFIGEEDDYYEDEVDVDSAREDTDAEEEEEEDAPIEEEVEDPVEAAELEAIGFLASSYG